MENKQAALSPSFENKIMNLIKGKASGFRGSRALAEGLAGGALGAGAGALSEAKKEHEGQFEGMSPEEKLRHYLGSAARYGAVGAGLGGLKGSVSGAKMLESAGRKHLGEMTPFLEEQLAKGVGERTLLKKLKSISPMSAKDYLAGAEQKGLVDSAQEMFAGVQPSIKKPVSFGDIVAGTRQEEALAAKKLEEAGLKKEQKALAKAEKEKLRRGTLTGELARAEQARTGAEAKSLSDITNKGKREALVEAQNRQASMQMAQGSWEKYLANKDANPLEAAKHLQEYSKHIENANIAAPLTLGSLAQKASVGVQTKFNKEIWNLASRQKKIEKQLRKATKQITKAPSEELARAHQSLSNELASVKKELEARKGLIETKVKNPEKAVETAGETAKTISSEAKAREGILSERASREALSSPEMQTLRNDEKKISETLRALGRSYSQNPQGPQAEQLKQQIDIHQKMLAHVQKRIKSTEALVKGEGNTLEHASTIAEKDPRAKMIEAQQAEQASLAKKQKTEKNVARIQKTLEIKARQLEKDYMAAQKAGDEIRMKAIQQEFNNLNQKANSMIRAVETGKGISAAERLQNLINKNKKGKGNP